MSGSAVKKSAPRRLEVAASNEWPFRFDVLGSEELMIDASYQRPLSRFVKEIVEHFNPALVGTLIVSQRQKKYAVIDGQTRLAAMRQLGHLQVPCLVFSGLTRADEARLFASFQTERKSMRPYHRFRAAVVAGDEDAIAIERIAKDAGFELSDNAGVDAIAAVSALEAAYHRGPDILTRTLNVIYQAWTRHQHAASGEVIRGLAYFLEKRDDIDDGRLIRHLSVVEPVTLKRRASALREGRGHGGNSPRYMAEAIAAAYSSRVP